MSGKFMSMGEISNASCFQRATGSVVTGGGYTCWNVVFLDDDITTSSHHV